MSLHEIVKCSLSTLKRFSRRMERDKVRERESACVTPIKELTLAELGATLFHLFDKASFGVI